MGDCKYCEHYKPYFETYFKCSLTGKDIINSYFNECEFYEPKNICLNCVNANHYLAIIKDVRTSVHKCKISGKMIDHDDSCDDFIALSCRRR